MPTRPTAAPPKAPAAEPVPPGTMLCCFTVPGRAVPWTPSRVTRYGTYKPKRLRQWQNTVAQYARLAWGNGAPYGGRVEVTFEVWIVKPPYPDGTNVQKGVEDALQRIVIDNDRQVAKIRTVMMHKWVVCREDKVAVTVYMA